MNRAPSQPQDLHRISPLSLGKTIRRLRKSRRLTQDELSERVGLKRPDLTRIEKGESLVSLETMLRIFKELDVNAEEVALGIQSHAKA